MSRPRNRRNEPGGTSRASSPQAPICHAPCFLPSSRSAGVNIGYRYDEANRLAFVDDGSGAGGGSVIRTHAYTYNPNGSLESVQYSNGVTHSYGYDTLNRLRFLDVTVAGVADPGSSGLHSYTYKLTQGGHRRQVVEAGKTTTYAYDNLYRLTGEIVAGATAPESNGAVSYDLDKVGNRLARASDLAGVLPQSGRSYNVRDWLGTDSYDANGNTLSGALAPLAPDLAPETTVNDVYDFENRLIVRQKADGSRILLAYDADGIRIGKTFFDSSGQLARSTHFLVCTNNLTGYAQVLEESSSDATGTSLKVYTYGSDLISCTKLAADSSQQTAFYSYDGGGSVRELTDEAGTITDRYTYDAFGVLLHLSGTTSNNYLYAGEQYDPDLSLYNNRARYLNPDSGRFWTMDVYEGRSSDPLSLHKYLYAHGNPVGGRDPSGQAMTMAEIGAVGAIVGTLVAIALPQVRQSAANAGGAVWALLVSTDLRTFTTTLEIADEDQILVLNNQSKQTKKVIDGLLDQAAIHAGKLASYSGGGGGGPQDPRDHWKTEIKAWLSRAKDLVTKRLKGDTRDSYLKKIDEIATKTGVTPE